MRETTRGLEPGTRIQAKGLGKHSKGDFMGTRKVSVTDPLTDDTLEGTWVEYRCDYNQGVHMVPLFDVKIIRTKKSKKEAFTE